MRDRPDLRPDAAAGPRARPVLRRGGVPAAWPSTCPAPGSWSSSRRPTRERPIISSARSWRPSGRSAERDFLLAYSPERIDPGNDEFGFRTPRGSWAAPRPRRPGVATALLRAARRQGGRAVLVPGGGAGQAAGEHVPPREHRARQRDGDPLPRDGDRRLGGRRRGRDQAVRLHVLLPGSRGRGSLHPPGPDVPGVAGHGARPVISSGSSSRRRT